MKVKISVVRRTEYCSIVEMTPERFRELDAALDSDNRKDRILARKAVNELIDVKDWQDDELDSIDEFEELEDQLC